ncbi:MAG: 1,4-dihydroxy-2-naphthoate polyprenyltransferase [Thermoanaerobaculia bacterium]|nr:1,4-dihydroxy-2-naphthoate polyprenyltransferase [Thermoanaerobaculia bacterium]
MLKSWILAARPATLTAAAVPVAVGAACAQAAGGLRPLPTLAALLGALWIQIGTNFANDVFDYEKGADTEERVGPVRAVASGLLAPELMRRGMWLAFGVAFAFGVYLTWVGGWPILIVGVVSILSGIAYTGGPYPLGYHGLGDLFVLVFFGFVAVCGTVWVNLLALTDLAWWASVPPGALATAILVVNNVRDVETDALAGKRTLAVRFGRRAGFVEYMVLLAAAYGVPGILFGLRLSGPWVLLPILTLPLAVVLIRRLVVLRGAELNPVLASTARLLLLYGVLFALGIALDS